MQSVQQCCWKVGGSESQENVASKSWGVGSDSPAPPGWSPTPFDPAADPDPVVGQYGSQSAMELPESLMLTGSCVGVGVMVV